ncbi:hypothetical protein BBO99_00009358 [Phytophthora kernoviae]|uniref:Uncharacterized protein n=1 Tax=Phytophthora kernoviae TaxID=325452 RepID=A0A3R7HBV3_9STRA|nr:hypothetical protein JM16_009266 [Phytophthora kernoviae]RLN45008.1 hypothetical protein BBI17_009380 [Phytophthora kernoviae]RLN73551.1 hypothetical protein BBO99_00009358 [Phytophthora kernoviae]
MSLVAEYFQTICGPTKFIGEIDDGSAEKALGLSTVGDAFNSSSGSWTMEGDGTVTINFQSKDTKDVSVNIMSAGKKVDKVHVATGETATWTSNVTALGGKTLYLDRWRPGFLGIPGTGGGSLLLWVPRSTKVAAIKMTSRLLPSAAAALRRRQDPKLAGKFNLAALNGGKSPFIVNSNRLLKVNKNTKLTPQQRVTDKFSLEYLLGDSISATQTTKKNPFHVTSSKLM